MGYMHIQNLYKDQTILMFKQCYALEKIHGTSAHVLLRLDKTFNAEGFAILSPYISFYSGGEKKETFEKLFDRIFLLNKFKESLFSQITFYGEAYGGKQQGMRDTYGDCLKFVVFDVKMGDKWLDVPKAEEFSKLFGFEFVHYEIIDTNIESLDKVMTEPSVQAIRNGKGIHEREGVVLRPLFELIRNNDDRIIAKHKNPKFQERQHQPRITRDKLVVLSEANTIAQEWVTEIRLQHVLNTLQVELYELKESDIPELIKAMIEDVEREAKEEILESKEVRRAIGKKTVEIFKTYLRNKINE